MYILISIALMPGFMYTFSLISLIIHRVKKVKKTEERCSYPEITVVIPAYNAGAEIAETIESIMCSDYPSPIKTIVVDDGSYDNTVHIIENHFSKYARLIKEPHRGKARTLNSALDYIDTKYFITLDSDTVLHKNAIINIVDKMTSKKYAAVAGALMPKNDEASFITKIQCWDYSTGIFGIKLVQSFFSSTLVMQGAFSIYNTHIVKLLGGWQDCIGEDIVLTWSMLAKGYKTSFAPHALALTRVPTKLKALIKQRRRWARGMIEGFKSNTGVVLHKRTKLISRAFIFFDLFFPFIDLGISIFIPIGILMALHGMFIIVEPMFLLLIPLTILLNFVINCKYKRAMRHAHYKPKRRSFFGYIGYMFVYQLFLSPVCFIGYLEEILYREKTW